MPIGVITKGNHICQPTPPVTEKNSPCASSAITAKPADITPVIKAPAQNTSRDFHNRDEVTSAEDRRIMPLRNALRVRIAQVSVALCLGMPPKPARINPLQPAFPINFWKFADRARNLPCLYR
jgi:hypothetical protein